MIAPRLLGAPWLLLVLALAGCHGPGAFQLVSATGGDGGAGRAPLRAGVATVELTPEVGYPLGGYGGGERRGELPFYAGMGWPGQIALWAHQRWHEEGPVADMLVPSTGVHDPLTARALVLRVEGAPPLALVRVDAIGVTRELHDLVAGGVADLGYTPDRVLLGATHTHSGAACFMRHAFARLVAMDNFRPEVEQRMAAACIAAVRSAHEGARPARLGVGMAKDRGPDGQTLLAKNRRAGKRSVVAPDAIDDEALLLRIDDAATGAPLCVVVNYAVHPTVLGQANLEFSADLAGGIERGLEAHLGGAPALFWNGAQGDVGPRALTIKEPHGRITEVGAAFGDLIAPAVLAIETHAEVRARTAVGDVDLGHAGTLIALGRERFVDSHRSLAQWPMELLTLPVNVLLWTAGLCNVRVALTYDLALGVVVDLDAYLERSATRAGGLRLEVGDDDVALLSMPGEPTHDVGLALRAAARRRGATRAGTLGLTFDHIGYIASEAVYREGGYEAQSTLFGIETSTRLLEAQERVLDALGFPSGS